MGRLTMVLTNTDCLYRVIVGVTALSIAAIPITAHAQSVGYPSKPIRWIVPQAPGTSIDILTRFVAKKLSEAIGQSVVVENRAGGGGVVGTDFVAKAAPDGQTILMGNFSTHAANPALYRKLPYDAVSDFAPITLVATYSHMLAVHPSLPAKTVKDLIQFAKRKPGEINYASAGNGSAQHLAGELFKSMAGVDLAHVPYKGGGPAMTALMGGEVAVMFPTTGLVLPHAKAGKVRLLAVTSRTRVDAAPEVPTLSESGVAGYELAGWLGALAPAKTHPATVEKLDTEIVRIVQAPDTRTTLAAYGLETTSSTPDQFAQLIKSEIAKWTKLAQKTGIHAE